VSEELWDRVQDVLSGRGNKPSKRTRDDPRLPLRRFVYCAWCETPITGSFTVKRLADGSSTGHGYYRCRMKACRAGDDGRWNIRKDDLEREFLAEVRTLAVTAGLASIFADILREVWKDRNNSKEQARKTLEQKHAGLAEEQTRLTKAYGRGVMPDAVYDEQIKRNLAELTEVGVDLDRIRASVPDAAALLPLAERVLSEPATLWQDADPATRLVFQRFLFPEGLPFDGESIGTAVTSPLYSHLRAWQREKKEMVTPRGFEPLSPG
jgi:site-specific DNA recombinase